MSLPAERVMPVVEAVGPRPDRSYLVCLPAGIQVIARNRGAVEEVVRRNAPGSAVRYVPWSPVSR